MARRDPDYKFVLAELDYLKPYWDAYPEDREYVRELLAEGRLEFIGGTYNEPNTNLTSAEIDDPERDLRHRLSARRPRRSAGDGVAARRVRSRPAVPGDHGGRRASPRARGRAGRSTSGARTGSAVPAGCRSPSWRPAPVPLMQFPMEFDWIAPSGRALLTSYMADHYSAGWWMDAALISRRPRRRSTRSSSSSPRWPRRKNVLLPVGTDYTPPNKWVTAIQRDWNSRYVWPKFVTAHPAGVLRRRPGREAAGGRPFSPQTRDMNPIYTGKDVSFIDTKQAQRVAENTLLAAEKFGTIASLFGARFPAEAIDKAWRQLLFGAHHDGITGSESDQVYLDLLGGWREAVELGRGVLDGALRYLGAVDRHEGRGRRGHGLQCHVVAADGHRPCRGRRAGRFGRHRGPWRRRGRGGAVRGRVRGSREDQKSSRATIAFLAADVPALGYRTFRIVPSDTPIADSGWHATDGTTIENEAYRVSVDPARAGAIDSVLDKRSGLEDPEARRGRERAAAPTASTRCTRSSARGRGT